MTTAHSPLHTLRAQADKIAAVLKAAERGEKIEARFAERIAATRHRSTFKVGIVMDDKVITLDIPWAVIRTTTESTLSKWILNEMREHPETTQ